MKKTRTMKTKQIHAYQKRPEQTILKGASIYKILRIIQPTSLTGSTKSYATTNTFNQFIFSQTGQDQ
jgi:hypothetical protein